MTKLHVVATPIGNLDDVSLRAKKVLQEVDWIAAEDTRHSGRLLQHLQIDTPLYAYHQHNEQQSCERFVQHLCEGKSGAIITDAGTPCISDPGFYLVQAARKHNIEVVSVPGPSACVAALSICGLPIQRFTFFGFLPPKQGARQQMLTKIQGVPAALIFYEAPHRILPMLQDCAQILGESRQAFVAREITKQYEQGVQQTLGECVHGIEKGDIPEKGEFVVIIEGAPDTPAASQDDVDTVLKPLLNHLSLKQAVEICVEMTGLKKNTVYARAVELKG